MGWFCVVPVRRAGGGLSGGQVQEGRLEDSLEGRSRRGKTALRGKPPPMGYSGFGIRDVISNARVRFV